MAKKEKVKKNKKKSNSFYKILSFILIVISVLAASVILYFEVLPTKYLIVLFVILALIVLGISYKLNSRTSLFTKLLMSLLTFIILLIEAVGIFYAFGTIDFLNNIFDTGFRVETYNVYVLKDSPYEKLKDLKDKKISVYESSAETYEKAVLRLNNKLDYDKHLEGSITTSINQVINKETEAVFISESLISIYKEDHEEEYKQLRVLDSIDILTKTKGDFKIVDVRRKPFVVYLSGSDAEGSINKVSRSDVNLLAVVNPKKGKIILINTPRDYYIALASKNAKDKLTHAGIYGIEESALTLAALYEVDVNYYARVNFTSFVKIIDALNGIEVDSKFSFSYDGYTFKKGSNSLTGASALAFSRGRSMLPEGDISRGYNQQAVIAGIINKVSSPSLLTKYNSLLNSLESGVMTNIDKNAITKLVNLQLDENIKWEIENYNAKGTGADMPTYSAGSVKLSVLEPDEESINEIKLKIKELMN
ncbi:MAG: LCP family protein [Bacilli bacterium]|nr:LCP family protein [Bacilli bacterium]